MEMIPAGVLLLFPWAVRENWRRLKGNGKLEKVARITLARKSLLIGNAVYCSGQPYRASEGSGR